MIIKKKMNKKMKIKINKNQKMSKMKPIKNNYWKKKQLKFLHKL